MAMARAHAADAVAHVHAIDAAGSSDGPVMDGEDDGVALGERDHFGARLHARPLLGEYEFAAGEIAGRREQERDLDGEDEVAVEILMEAVVIAGTVLEQERGRLGLTGVVAALQ